MVRDSEPLGLILAPGSARRELSERTGWPMEVTVSDAVEPMQGCVEARPLVQAAAWAKAAATASRVDRGLVLAAATIGWLDWGLLLKSRDEADARRMSRGLAGHDLSTRMALLRPQEGGRCFSARPTSAGSDGFQRRSLLSFQGDPHARRRPC
jgi:predicted house-cleaning NTP pyrophosphatase (Maf/HAM1 superfamily)